MDSDVVGISCCLLSATLFGSMFVPIRGLDIGNGLFVQWVMSVSILLFGFLVFAIDGFDKFYPLAMLGGFFWAIGNSTAVPIIQRVGMALGILIWNTTNCLAGWAAGRFGFFGMKQHIPENISVNYLGLSLVVLGGFTFTFVNSTATVSTPQDDVEMIDPNKRGNSPEIIHQEESLLRKNDHELKKPDKTQRILAILLAVCAGFFYGITFLPVNFMIERTDIYPTAPRNGIHYIFSHYSGIFITSCFLMIIYSIWSKSQPFVSGSLILPSTLTGIMWAIAQSSFFLANQLLSQTISFPIITMLPGCLASMWSFFFFKEIKGKKNILLTLLGISITMIGVVLVAISK
ncbi:unnamed protein product [Auanema sp. JU1783]|nr:unnamed protein product [Auanema sp. JU1783]